MTSTVIPSFDDIISILHESGNHLEEEESDQIQMILSQCDNDKNKFISIIIQAHFQHNTSPKPSTSRLSQETAGIILYRYMSNIDLDTSNIIAMASHIIPKLKKGNIVDIGAVSHILRENGVSGLVFVKGTKDYMNGAKFSRLFISLDNWKENKGVFSRFWREMNKWEPMVTDNMDKDAITKHDDQINTTLSGGTRRADHIIISVEAEEEQKGTSSPDATGTECKLSFSECTSCQRIKSVLARYQSAVSQLSHTDQMRTNSQKIIDDLFDENYSATDLLDDFQHIIREHHVDDEQSQFDLCFEFMINTAPRISCDISKCKAARLYFSRRRGKIDEMNSGNVEIPSDYRAATLWQIHSYFVHSLETTMLTKKERMDIEEEIKMRDEDLEDERDELELKLVTEKMRQKSMVMNHIMDDPDNTKFVTSNVFVDSDRGNEDEEKLEDLTIGDEEEMKYPEEILERRRSTIYRDDEHILREFCSLTSCDPAIAVLFLNKSEWNLHIAMNRFYEFNGDHTQIDSFLEQKENVSVQQDDGVYTEGIQFWYWGRDEMPSDAIPVKPRHETLKDEIMSTGLVGMTTWTCFVAQCQTLLEAKFVRQLTANGVDEHVYNIKAGDAFVVKWLLALKLYTDFDALNTMFCEHFRLKKLSQNQFETVRSLVNRNRRFWHFAKLLVECVQCFGRLLVCKKSRFYRGIGRRFILKRFVARFHVPLSTSKSVCTVYNSFDADDI